MRSVAHFVDVAGADALLHVGQARALRVLGAQQIGNQRVHARGGEQNGGVVLRNDGGRGDDRMAVILIEFQEHRAQLGGSDVFHKAHTPFLK